MARAALPGPLSGCRPPAPVAPTRGASAARASGGRMPDQITPRGALEFSATPWHVEEGISAPPSASGIGEDSHRQRRAGGSCHRARPRPGVAAWSRPRPLRRAPRVADPIRPPGSEDPRASRISDRRRAVRYRPAPTPPPRVHADVDTEELLSLFLASQLPSGLRVTGLTRPLDRLWAKLGTQERQLPPSHGLCRHSFATLCSRTGSTSRRGSTCSGPMTCRRR